MASIVYIHGFLSSPKSFKAQCAQAWLAENSPTVEFYCPPLSAYPCEAKLELDKLFENLDAKSTFLIGSSLGGFWATNLIERGLAEKAVLVNPAVRPQERICEFMGKTLKSYYSEDSYTLGERDIADLMEYDFAELSDASKYWLMVQIQDETLDYRQAVEKYKAVKQLVEEGGNHSFQGFDNWLPEIMNFFQITHTNDSLRKISAK